MAIPQFHTVFLTSEAHRWLIVYGLDLLDIVWHFVGGNGTFPRNLHRAWRDKGRKRAISIRQTCRPWKAILKISNGTAHGSPSILFPHGEVIKQHLKSIQSGRKLSVSVELCKHLSAELQRSKAAVLLNTNGKNW